MSEPERTDTMTCPDCGLEVYADRRGFPKRHARRAVEAGFKDADCVQRARVAEHRYRQNVKDRNRWAKELAEKREQAANAESRLPKHLR